MTDSEEQGGLSERRFQEIVDQISDALLIDDRDGRVIYGNRAFRELFGLSEEELAGLVLEDYVAAEYREPLRKRHERRMRGENATARFKFVGVRSDGSRRQLEVSVVPVHDEDGELVGTQSAIRDVTQRAETMQSLARANELLAALINAMPLGVTGLAADDTVALWNPAAEQIFGWKADEVIGKPYPLAPDEDMHAEHLELLGRNEAGVPLVGHETRRRRRDGELIDVAIWSGLIGDAATDDLLSVGVLADISERKRAEALLRESAEHYQLLFESHPHPMLCYDVESLRIVDVNQAVVEFYGYTREELLARSLRDLPPPEGAEALEQRVRSIGRGLHRSGGPFLHQRKDGTTVYIEAIGNDLISTDPTARRERLVQINDMTQQVAAEQEARQRQAEVRQLQRMDAMGKLAGGVAHDFNNILTAIFGFAAVAHDQAQPGSEQAADLVEITAAAERASLLTRQLLTFSRHQVNQPEMIALDAFLEPMRAMLGRLVSDDIVLEMDLAARGAVVLADVGQLQQVVLNLVVNASDAMPAGGRLWLKTLADANSVTLLVSDSGSGIPAEELELIFEPFFSTKDAERGTGLGLSTVYGIIRQHQGHIEVESEPGRGTTFRIVLPRAERDSARLRRLISTEPAQSESAQIVVVDDDPRVRQVVVRALRSAGHEVLEAATPREVRTAFEQTDGAIGLLISDVVMPELSGPDLVDELLVTWPETRVLFVSGHISDDRGREKVRDRPFLQKPFTPDQLCDAVQRAMTCASD